MRAAADDEAAPRVAVTARAVSGTAGID